jgi:hypothetical protein
MPKAAVVKGDMKITHGDGSTTKVYGGVIPRRKGGSKHREIFWVRGELVPGRRDGRVAERSNATGDVFAQECVTIFDGCVEV